MKKTITLLTIILSLSIVTVTFVDAAAYVKLPPGVYPAACCDNFMNLSI